MEEFQEKIQFKHGRYEVLLPWKEKHLVLPDNYELSLKRLKILICHLQQDPDILKEVSLSYTRPTQEGDCGDGGRTSPQ